VRCAIGDAQVRDGRHPAVEPHADATGRGPGGNVLPVTVDVEVAQNRAVERAIDYFIVILERTS
jgi:hypothetical protein